MNKHGVAIGSYHYWCPDCDSSFRVEDLDKQVDELQERLAEASTVLEVSWGFACRGYATSARVIFFCLLRRGVHRTHKRDARTDSNAREFIAPRKR